MATEATAAFRLGWYVAELYHYERLPGEAESDKPDSLSGIGRLPQKVRANLLTMQIEVILGQLDENALDLSEIRQQLQAERVDVGALKQAVGALHVSMLKTLTAKDAMLGKAYGLGRALAETMLVPSTNEPKTFSDQFGTYRIGTLQADLADLKSGLPRYSADAVSRTLDSWSKWVVAEKIGADTNWDNNQRKRVGQCIRRQGEIWYGLLAGEIDPLQLLRPEDYVAASQSLLAYIGELSWSFLTGSEVGRLLGLLAIGAVVLLIAVSMAGYLAAVAGVAVLLLGTFGITAGGVASSVRQVLAQAQAPLWEAELTNGVAAAGLRLPALDAVTKEAGASNGAEPASLTAGSPDVALVEPVSKDAQSKQ